MDWDYGAFLGGVVGGLIGAAGAAGSVVWSFRKGASAARVEMGQRAAAEILEDLHFCEAQLSRLPHTDSPTESPLSYRERADAAQPILDRLQRTNAVLVPQLTDAEIRTRVVRRRELCEQAVVPSVNFTQLRDKIKGIREHLDNVRASLDAYLNGMVLPPS
ncbi:hypothetical protein [Streptacidiphilus sp. P02-A3a]|uniref:hypothetical protein n=1 Tax=Streptacidiphilus sp. P02-A3a TaxID=2704468 RepID=UPI0015FE3271|nr:hypothetical protein [Streptacidiphilus sp. P02-A3a]QMU73445.1 hypothetical protein GXP74_39690 [Streptacidiphilus sp. P02-A3a]